MTSATSAIKHRPWVALCLLLGLGIALLGAPLAGIAGAVSDSDSTDATGEAGVESFGTVIADVVVIAPPGEWGEAEAGRLVDTLSALQGVAWVADDATSEPGPNILVGFTDSTDSAALEAVRNSVQAHPDGSEMPIVGRAVADQEVSARVGSAMLVAVGLATVAFTLFLAWFVGIPHGLLGGATLAVSAWLGGVLGERATGPFDGSIVTTALPAVLAAVLVSVVLTVRLLSWFDDPVGDDQADLIRRSVLELGMELVLIFAGLIVSAIFLELVGPARSVATVVLVGAVTGTVLTLAIAAPVLAALDSASGRTKTLAAMLRGEASGVGSPIPDGLPYPRPNGRDFPVGVLLGFGVFLGLFGLLSFQATSPADLLDEKAVADAEADSEQSTQRLDATGGDPTNAVLAVYPAGVDQLAKTAWLQRVSQLPSVGRVDTSIGRYVSGQLIEIEGGVVGPLASVIEGDEAPRFALVVPSVAGRGPAARELVDAVQATNAPVNAELSGAPVDAWRAENRDRSLIWLTMISLALVAGIAAFVLVGDLAVAGAVAGLHLVSSMAIVGLSQMLSNAVSGAELQLIIVIVALGTGLFELGFLRRLLLGHLQEPTDELLDEALTGEGWAAVMGLAMLMVASLGLVVADIAVVRRLGILVTVALLIEIVIGLWLLRPAVLGTRAIAHFATEPVRSALKSLDGGGVTDEADYQRWTVIVSNLLHAEFHFQADPAQADMGHVFVPDTPLYDTARDHHVNLAGAGLRIIGRNPQLRHLRVLDVDDPVTVAVTVDHPARQLVNGEGAIVGVRKAERHSVMLWMVGHTDGTYRISDSVELGTLPLDEAEEPMAGVASTATANP